MPIPLPQSVKKLLQDKAYGHVVTYNDKGTAQLTMVWMDVDGDDVVFSGEFAQDRKRAADFAAEAREKTRVAVRKSGTRAFVLVGNEDWPFPVPLVKRGGKWFFDSKAGRIASSTVSQKIDLIIKVMNVEVNQSTDTSTTIKLVDPTASAPK